MKKIPNLVRITAIGLLMINLPILAFSQAFPLTPTSDSLIKTYSVIYKVDPRLISGDFYLNPWMNAASGHPFYLSPEWKSGSVTINNTEFSHLLLKYDVCSNKVVLNTANITSPTLQIALINKNIKSFTLDHHHFIVDPSNPDPTSVRFCEVLAEGRLTLLNRMSKKLSLPGTGTKDFVYETRISRFLIQGDQILKYHGKKTLFKLYPDFKHELRTFIRKENLTINKNHPFDNGQLVNYLNSLLEDRQ